MMEDAITKRSEMESDKAFMSYWQSKKEQFDRDKITGNPVTTAFLETVLIEWAYDGFVAGVNYQASFEYNGEA